MGTPMDYSTIVDGYQYIKVFHEANSSSGMLLRKNNKDSNNNDNDNDTETISSLSNEQDEDEENSVNEQQEKDQQQNEDKVTTCCDNDNASGDKLLLESPTNEAQSKSITLETHLIKKSPQVTADNDTDTLSECNTNSK
jgi:hypothetical protein